MHLHAHTHVCAHTNMHTPSHGIIIFLMSSFHFSSPLFSLNSMSDKSLSSLCDLLSLLQYLTLAGHFIYSLFEWKGGGDAVIYISYTVKYIIYKENL